MTLIYKMLIKKAKSEFLYSVDGKKIIDLFSGHGAVSLGHQYPAIVSALKRQMAKVWLTGGLSTIDHFRIKELIKHFFPKNYKLGVLYSTGMEAVEFALRAALIHTRKKKIISFAGSMHGKSVFTSALGWVNNWQLPLSNICRLPSLRQDKVENILVKVKKLINKKDVAAIIIEGYQCSNGGLSFPKRFYDELVPFCRRNKVLIIFDEILTGFYRTGSLFCFSKYGFIPDIILLGKSLGNGFPVSAVVLRKDIKLKKEMLPQSTFSNNPLALAVVAETLFQYQKTGWQKKALRIASIVRGKLKPLVLAGFKLRGAGACWILEFPLGLELPDLTQYFLQRGIAVNQVNNYLRLLPPLTIKPRNLEQACKILSTELYSLTVSKKSDLL